ncbi:hypothetical protein M0R45_006067 [Rubus argutus]|uniref:Uncharacterized protein n=1 Tax=Rubus argutus TaxID=59490 RepID=A0AAW1YPF0_RUBAR
MMKAITKKSTKRISNSANLKNPKIDFTVRVSADSSLFLLPTPFAIFLFSTVLPLFTVRARTVWVAAWIRVAKEGGSSSSSLMRRSPDCLIRSHGAQPPKVQPRTQIRQAHHFCNSSSWITQASPAFLARAQSFSGYSKPPHRLLHLHRAHAHATNSPHHRRCHRTAQAASPISAATSSCSLHQTITVPPQKLKSPCSICRAAVNPVVPHCCYRRARTRSSASAAVCKPPMPYSLPSFNPGVAAAPCAAATSFTKLAATASKFVAAPLLPSPLSLLLRRNLGKYPFLGPLMNFAPLFKT